MQREMTRTVSSPALGNTTAHTASDLWQMRYDIRRQAAWCILLTAAALAEASRKQHMLAQCATSEPAHVISKFARSESTDTKLNQHSLVRDRNLDLSTTTTTMRRPVLHPIVQLTI